MSAEFVCVTIPADKQEKYRYALDDINCWMNGFTQAGGEYSPDSVNTLRDIRDMIARAYPTCAPQTSVPVLVYTPPPGAQIDYAVKEAMKLAKAASCILIVSFNEKKFSVSRTDKLSDVMQSFDNATKYPKATA